MASGSKWKSTKIQDVKVHQSIFDTIHSIDGLHLFPSSSTLSFSATSDQMEWSTTATFLRGQLQADVASSSNLKKIEMEKDDIPSHHEYMMQEMQWMATDFVQERTWKSKKKRKIHRFILKFHQKKIREKLHEGERQEKERLLKCRKLAKEVKTWWKKIDKIVAFKLKLQYEMIKKVKMDTHLRFLIGQTERYASSMIEDFKRQDENEEHPWIQQEEVHEQRSEEEYKQRNDEEDVHAQRSEEEEHEQRNEEEEDVDGNEKRTSRKRKRRSLRMKNDLDMEIEDSEEEEYEENEEDIIDDERTIEQAEGRISKRETAMEIEQLERENQMTVEELRAFYYNQKEEEEETVLEMDKEMDEDESEEDFCPPSPEMDDETSIAKEEHQDRQEESVHDELQALSEDNDLSIEALRAKYMNIPSPSVSPSSTKSSCHQMLSMDIDDNTDPPFELSSEEMDDESTLIEDEKALANAGYNTVEELDALKDDAQLSIEELRMKYKKDMDEENKTSDGTPSLTVLSPRVLRPFLLSPNLILREYQHVGLEWLASMYTKRLNGILADEMGKLS